MNKETVYSSQYGRCSIRTSHDGRIVAAYAKELGRTLDELERHLLEAELAGGTEL